MKVFLEVFYVFRYAYVGCFQNAKRYCASKLNKRYEYRRVGYCNQIPGTKFDVNVVGEIMQCLIVCLSRPLGQNPVVIHGSWVVI